MNLDRTLVDLTLKANGKTDLYFHGYFWLSLSQSLYLAAHEGSTVETFDTKAVKPSVELQRLKGLSDFLNKVSANMAKFTFSKDVYDRFVNDFGGRKPVKHKKLLEDIQKYLLFA